MWGNICRHCGPRHTQVSPQRVWGTPHHSPLHGPPLPPGCTLHRGCLKIILPGKIKINTINPLDIYAISSDTAASGSEYSTCDLVTGSFKYQHHKVTDALYAAIYHRCINIFQTHLEWLDGFVLV